MSGADGRPEIRVGCSGWVYPDWRRVVYPDGAPQRTWFEHYQQRFDTVELNATFYRLPTAEAVRSWASAARPGFVYAFKMGAFGSHRKKLSDSESWLPKHLERAQLLGDHLGPTLVQLPPRWRRNVARLDEFLATARRLADRVPDAPPMMNRWAVEVRDPTWLHPEVFDTLRRHDAALCIHDMLPSHPFELTSDWTYVRFHGPDAVEHAYQGSYGRSRLRLWADRLAMVSDGGHDVYAYFNNDTAGHAVRDAETLRAMLAAPRNAAGPDASA